MAEMPAVQFSMDDIMSGGLAALEARTAQEHGPIFKWPIHEGPEAGREFVFMVGPEANRFVLHSHRAHFSHDLGLDADHRRDDGPRPAEHGRPGARPPPQDVEPRLHQPPIMEAYLPRHPACHRASAPAPGRRATSSTC